MNDDPNDFADSAAARDSPEANMLQQRNAFYGSLSIAAKDQFLRALERAAREGLTHEEAWKEAVIAAETTYPTPEQLAPSRMPPLKEETR